MYDAKEEKAYVYNVKGDCKFNSFYKWINYLKNQKCFKGNRLAVANIFLKLNPSSLSIASILYTSDYIPYWRTKSLINSADILSLIQERILPGGEFADTSMQEISGGLEFQFFKKE